MVKYLYFITLFTSGILFSQKKSPNAISIINKVFENTKNNSTRIRFPFYEYTNYNKIIFSAQDSLISDKIDFITDYRLKSFLKTRADSTSYKFKQEIKNKHFFIAEKISKQQYNKAREREDILAVKMAGFKEPIYEFISLSVANINFYKNKINLFGSSYVSPIAKNATKDYTYNVIGETNTNYIIKFKSNRKKSIGLEGELTIHKNSFAITKVKTNIKGKVTVQLIQHYKYLEKQKHWFANEMTIILTKGTSKISTKAFRRLIGFRPKYSASTFHPEDVSYIQITSKNYNFNVAKPPKITLNDYDINVTKKGINRQSPLWDSIENNIKEKRTYLFLDSIVKQHHVEKKIIALRKFLTGQFATKIIDVNLSQVTDFNNYEGIRLGFGGSSNESLSSVFKINGYANYGLKDKKIKYQYGLSFLVRKHSNTWISLNQTDDIYEAAKPKLLFNTSDFALINPRKTNISQFYNYNTSAITISHDFAPYITTKTQFSTGKYHNLFPYRFINRTKNSQNYNLTNVSFAIEWTPFSKYMKTPRGKFLVKNAYPKINAEITKNFNTILDGSFNFTQVNVKVDQEFKTIKSGSTQVLIKGGYTFGEAPFSHLYNHGSNHALSSPWRSRINLSGTDAFETMLFNEFISDKYISIQARQNFEKFRIGKNFKPKLSIVTRFTIGTINNPINHQGVSFKSLKKGFIESGIVLNQLFYGVGVSGFYRYGPHRFSNIEDNISLKITYVLGFL